MKWVVGDVEVSLLTTTVAGNMPKTSQWRYREKEASSNTDFVDSQGHLLLFLLLKLNNPLQQRYCGRRTQVDIRDLGLVHDQTVGRDNQDFTTRPASSVGLYTAGCCPPLIQGTERHTLSYCRCALRCSQWYDLGRGWELPQ